MNIAALIEKNRIAVLRMVLCWLNSALVLSVGGDKPLPRRLSAWVEGLLSKAEKTTGYLLIAIFYHGRTKRRFSPAFEKAAHDLLASNSAITLGTLTIAGIIKRLKALQHTLHNLHAIARRLAKSIAARARVSAIKMVALISANSQNLEMLCPVLSPEDAMPP